MWYTAHVVRHEMCVFLTYEPCWQVLAHQGANVSGASEQTHAMPCHGAIHPQQKVHPASEWLLPAQVDRGCMHAGQASVAMGVERGMEKDAGADLDDL